MTDKFRWDLLVVFELLHVAICYPTTKSFLRSWVFPPVMITIAVYLWTQPCQLSKSVTYTVGANSAFQLLSVVNLVYINPGFPNVVRRVKDGKELPTEFKLTKKLLWMLDLSYAVRRVGWVQEPKGALPPRPIHTSRTSFITSRLLYGAVHFLATDLILTYQSGNPAFDALVHSSSDGPEMYLRARPLPWRMLDLMSWGLALVCGLCLVHIVLAVVSVGLKLSDPADWPYMFGSFSETTTVRQFWGKTWHQRMRPVITGIGKHIANRTFAFRPGSLPSSYTQLYTAFLLSGLIHAGGDYIILKHFPLFPIRFFLLQAVAITLEDFVIWLTKPIHASLGRTSRFIGYVWVVSWLVWSGPLWLDEMAARGYYVNAPGAISGSPLVRDLTSRWATWLA